MGSPYDQSGNERQLRAALEAVVRTELPIAESDETLHVMANRLTAMQLHVGIAETITSRGPVSSADLMDLLEPIRKDVGELRGIVDAGRERLLRLEPSGTCDVRAVVLAEQERMRHAYPDIICESECPASFVVLGESALVEEALRHLTENAIEGDGVRGAKHLRLRLHEESTRIRLLIEDDGPGLPEPRADPGKPFHTTKPGRTGLGLFICRRIAMFLGGTFEIANAPGGGARAELALKRKIFD